MTAVHTLLTIASAHGMEQEVVIRGSAAKGATLVPFWSDIDVTFIVPRADMESLKRIREIRKAYEKTHQDIPLSIVVVNADDTITNTPLHHHGVKPLAYSLKLAKEQGWDVPHPPSIEALRESSAYHYYEIIHALRREIVNGEGCSPHLVARGFHRLAYLFKCQIEILHPEILVERPTVNPREWIEELTPRELAIAFFDKSDEVKARWGEIRGDKEELQRLGQYLADTYDECHRAFLPILRRYS